MRVKLSAEVIKSKANETDCDWCGSPLYVGDAVYVDLEHGTIYCQRACGEQDAFDRGYGPVCSGVSRW